MRCEHIDELLRSETKEGEAHPGKEVHDPSAGPNGGRCSECEEATALLARTRSLLSEHEPEPPAPGGRERVWRAVREAREPWWRRLRGRWTWASGAGLAAAATAALLLLLPSGDQAGSRGSQEAGEGISVAEAGEGASIAEPDEAETRVGPESERPRLGVGRALVVADSRSLKSGQSLPEETIAVTLTSTLELRRADVDAEGGTRLRVSRLEDDVEMLALDQGLVTARVAPPGGGSAFLIITEHGMVEVVGTRFSVRRDGGTTEVSVESGRVRVTPSGGEALMLGAGDSVVLPLEPKIPTREEPSIGQRHPPPAASPAKRAGPPSPEPDEPEPAPTIRDARKAVHTDPERAASIAEGLLDSVLEPSEEVAALAVLADAHRRRGGAGEAAGLYRRVADHPVGTGFAEEALVQLALLHLDEGGEEAALEALGEADARFGAGVLRPERIAIEAKIHLEAGRPAAAAAALETLRPGAATLEISHLRMAAARALLGSDPARSGGLADAVLEGPAGPELENEARDLLRRIRAETTLGYED